MTDREFVIAAMREKGLADAVILQSRSATMTGTEIKRQITM